MRPFRLQRVLDHRQRLEDAAQQALAEAQNLWQAKHDQRLAEEYALNDYQQQFEEQQRRGMSGLRLQYEQERLQLQEYYIRSLQQEEHQAEQLVKQRRQELLEARLNKEKLVKLKENHIESEKQAAQEAENRYLDEINTVFYGGRES